jgi:methyl-accepting chemotaxis protein
VINTTGSSIVQTTDLAHQAQAQALQVEETLKQIEQVVSSIQEVAQAAQQAETVVQKATQTAQAGGEAVDRTVDGINQLRVTIGEAAKMMKRLGEGSQQIGQIVTLISQIASKTDLLALNATIEAARAGEQGQGFAVVADEVRKLAERSASATKEIAELVDGIQTETGRMISAMDAGTEEVVRGTQLAANAKLNLQEIMQVSGEINTLVQNITRTTKNQTQVAAAISTAVKQTRTESTQTAQRATEVSTSLDELNSVVEQLQNSVQSFRTA